MQVSGKLTESQKLEIVVLRAKGYSFPRIARLMGTSLSTAFRTCDRCEKEKTVKRRPSPGRPRIIHRRDSRRIQNYIEANPLSNLTQIIQSLGLRISKITLLRHLHRLGLRKFVQRTKLFISETNRLARLKFARDHLDWGEKECAKFLFTDESTIMCNKLYKRRVWRKRGQAMQPGFYRIINA